MIDKQIKNSSSIFKCAHGHKLIEADYTKRKRKNGSLYNSPGYNCDICHHSFSNGSSWHCSCTDTGFDKCVACLVFQLYNIDNPTLKLASQDKEIQQERYRRETIRNIVRLPRGLFRLLTGNLDEDNDSDGLDLLALRPPASLLDQQNTFEGRDNDDETETNLRED
jgi:hypothetical protein